jgi:hypothetical protein
MIAIAPSQAAINFCASGETPVKAGVTSAMVTDAASRIEKKQSAITALAAIRK